jgi:prepilin-type N-terminal cleavage/methylation domain-containing protein
MKNQIRNTVRQGFTLMETVIAIGVIAVLITGFIAVFAPAVDGIRRSITAEEASRLTTTLERELVTLRPGEEMPDVNTGFAKAFRFIRDSNNPDQALLIYQYRGSLNAQRADDTPTPVHDAGGVAGTDFVTVSMVRRISDPLLSDDLQALEGRIFVVRCTQLVYDENGALVRGVPGQISDPKGGGVPADTAANYPEAVLTFVADFFAVPSRSPQYLQGPSFASYFEDRMVRPMFTRNLAVRR